MIFKTNVLKDLMKTAYKGHGLYVANKCGRIILGGAWWIVSIAEDVFPKKGRAALVELVGQLPIEGESFRCTSGGSQMEIPPFDIQEKIQEVDWNEIYFKTTLSIETPNGYIRPYQSSNDTIFLNECITELMEGKVEIGEDDGIAGPSKIKIEDEIIFMETDTCSIAVWEIRPRTEDGETLSSRNEFMQRLKEIKLPTR